MSKRLGDCLLWAAMFLLAVAMGMFVGFIQRGHATNLDGRYDNAPYKDWFASRVLTPAASKRFPFKSCCDNSDVVHTQFRVNKTNGSDEWWFINSNGVWQRVPEDIIWEDQPSPTGEAVMFAVGGIPVCFFPAESGQ